MCHANNINMIEACKQIDQIDGVNQKARSHIKDFVKAYDNFCDNSNNRKSLSEIATSVLADTGFYSHLSKQSETDDVSQKRIANVDELLLDIATYQNGNSSATLSDYLQSLQLMSDKEEDNNEGKVTLLTMHSAKGLEFRVVFIVGAEEGLIPHRQSKNIDEERRLMYVAMTRAMDLLNISYCTHRQSFNRYTKNTTMDSKGESMFLHEIRRQITN
jgi:DNA helicase-2/ATP-dependent DNA helicase PcrA